MINASKIFLADSIILILSYLVGSIIFGYLVVKLKTGKDIRDLGSGNAGATNVTRILGKKWGFLTFFLDIGKIFLVIKLCQIFTFDKKIIFAASYLAIIGHIFPIWFNFKGGKGVASAFAAIAYLLPKLGLILAAIWLLLFSWKRISSLSSIISFASVPVCILIMNYNIAENIFLLVTSLTIIFAHKANILRLLKGEEKIIKSRKN